MNALDVDSALRTPHSALGTRSVLHIDMNAFFASVEQRANPSLRGRPMAVVGSKHRGVVLSPSYEARAFGVKTGMTYGEAVQACPELLLVPADPPSIPHACEELIEIWKDFTPLVELFSIDEAFLDVTGCERLFGDPVRIAVRIKERIWNEMQLTCSIGIAPNKLLAKLGSDMQEAGRARADFSRRRGRGARRPAGQGDLRHRAEPDADPCVNGHPDLRRAWARAAPRAYCPVRHCGRAAPGHGSGDRRRSGRASGTAAGGGEQVHGPQHDARRRLLRCHPDRTPPAPAFRKSGPQAPARTVPAADREPHPPVRGLPYLQPQTAAAASP